MKEDRSRPSWREIGALVITILTITASTVAYAFTTFATKVEVQESLNRIEHKLDCVLNPKLCRDHD